MSESTNTISSYIQDIPVIGRVWTALVGDAEASPASQTCASPDIAIQVIPTPPSQAEEVFNNTVSRGVIIGILRNTPNHPEISSLSDETIEEIVGDMYEFMGQIGESRSNHFSRWMVSHITQEDHEYLRDCLRMIILRNIAESQSRVQDTPLPQPSVPPTLLDEAAVSAAAEGVLDPQMVALIQSGQLRLITREIRSNGNISGYSVRVQFGGHEETILEFREGRYMRGNPNSRERSLNQSDLPGDENRQEEIWNALIRAHYIDANGRILPAFSGRMEDLTQNNLMLELSDTEKNQVLRSLNALSRSPLARGLIIFLQRLLLNSGDLDQRQYSIQLGHCCRRTLEAFGLFTSAEMLDVDFELDSAQMMLDQRILEADQAFDSFQRLMQAPLGRNRHVQRQFRYEAGQRALDKIQMLIQLASRYCDIDRTDPNLSAEQISFIERCDQVIQQYRAQAREILGEFFNSQDPLIRISWNTIDSQRRQLERLQRQQNDDTRDPPNPRLFREKHDRMVSEYYQLISNLRRWRNIADHNTAMGNTIRIQTQAAITLMRQNCLESFPDAVGEERRMILQQLISNLSEETTNEIAGERIPENISTEQLLARFDRISRISERLAQLPAADTPQAQRNVAAARSVIISYISQFLINGDLAELEQLLNLFESYGSDLREATLFQIYADIQESQTSHSADASLNPAVNDLNWSHNDRGTSQHQRSMLSRLAYTIHSYNQGLPENQRVEQAHFVAAIREIVNGLQASEARVTREQFVALAESPAQRSVYENAWERISRRRDILDENGQVRSNFREVTASQLGIRGVRSSEARIIALRISSFLRQSRFVSLNECRQVMRVLSSTSDDLETSRIEIGEQRDRALTALTLRHNRQISGGRDRTLTPQLLHRLARRGVENTRVRGIVRGRDLHQMDHRHQLPRCIDQNGLYFVTSLGFHQLSGTDSYWLRGRTLSQAQFIELAQENEAHQAIYRDAWNLLSGDLQIIDNEGHVRSNFRGNVTVQDLRLEGRQGLSPEEAREIALNISLLLRSAQGIREIRPSRDDRTIYEREPTDFVANEPFGSLLLAAHAVQIREAARSDSVLQLPPTPDNLDLIVNGYVNCRLTADGVQTILGAFSEGTHWTVMPNRPYPTPAENAALVAIADRLAPGAQGGEVSESSGARIDQIIRRIANGSNTIRLTDEERAELIRWTNENYDDIDRFVDRHYPDPRTQAHQRDALRSAISKLRITANNYLRLKGGISLPTEAEQAAIRTLGSVSSSQEDIQAALQVLRRSERGCLEALSWYLSMDPNLSINNERITSLDPDTELVARLRELSQQQGRPFDEATFTAIYQRSMSTIRRGHRGLRTLASKFPPEERGWHGWFDFLTHNISEVWRILPEGVATPSQANYINVGASSDQLTEVNAITDPSLTDRLAVCNQRAEQLRERIHRDRHLQAAVTEIVDISTNELRNRRDLERIRDERLIQNNPEEARIINLINRYLDQLSQLEQFNRETLSYLYNADTLFERVLTLQTEVNREFQATQRELRTAQGEHRERRQIRLDALTQLKEGLDRVVASLNRQDADNPGLITARENILPVFEQLRANELQTSDVLGQLQSDCFRLNQYLPFRRTFYHAFNNTTLDADLLDFFTNILSGLEEEVTGPAGYSGMTIFQILDRYYGVVDRSYLPGSESRQNELWQALVNAEAIQQHDARELPEGVMSGNISFQGTEAEFNALITRLNQSRELRNSPISSEERETIMRLLQVGRYEVQGRRELFLSSFLPDTFEPDFTTLARIAFSQAMERLPRENHANVLSGLPSLLLGASPAFHGFICPTRDVPTAIGGVTGAGYISVGPTTQDDMLAFNNPLYRTAYQVGTFMALAQQRGSRMPLTASAYMQMPNSRSESTRRYYNSIVARPGRERPFERMDCEGVRHAYISMLVDAAFPVVLSPRLRHRVDNYLVPTHRVVRGSSRMVELLQQFAVNPNRLPGDTVRRGEIWTALTQAGYLDEFGIIQARFSGRENCLERLNDFLRRPLTQEEAQATLQELNAVRDRFNTYLEERVPQGQIEQSDLPIEDEEVRNRYWNVLIQAGYISENGNLRANFHGTLSEFQYVIRQYYPEGMQQNTEMEREVYEALQEGRDRFPLFDSRHPERASMRLIAEDMELASRVIADINQSLARQDASVNPLSFFNGPGTIDEIDFTHRDPNVEPTRRITVVHRDTIPEQNGEVSHGFDLIRTPLSWVGINLEHGYPLELMFVDTANWVSLNLLGGRDDEFEDPNIRRELGFTEGIWHAIRDGAQMKLNFDYAMPRNINLGLANTHRCTAEVVHAAGRLLYHSALGNELETESARSHFYNALRDTSASYAEMIANWSNFEALSFIFGMDIARKIEERNPYAALGLIPPILGLTLHNLKAPLNIARFAWHTNVANPEYVVRSALHRYLGIGEEGAASRIHRGRLDRANAYYREAVRGRIGLQGMRIIHKPLQYIGSAATEGARDTWRLRTSYIQEIQENGRPTVTIRRPITSFRNVRSFVGSVFHRAFVDPTQPGAPTPRHGTYALYRDAHAIYSGTRTVANHFAGTLGVEANVSQVQIRPLGDAAQEAQSPHRTWLGRRWSALRRYRTQNWGTRAWRYWERTGGLPTNIRDFIGSARVSRRVQSINTNDPILFNFEAARSNPGEFINLSFSNELQLTMPRQDYVDLVEARARSLQASQGGRLARYQAFRRFRHVARNLGFRGNVNQLYHLLQEPATAFIGDPNGMNYSGPRAEVFNPVRFLENATEGRGLSRTFNIEVQEPIIDPEGNITGNRPRSVRLTGRQVMQILNNQMSLRGGASRAPIISQTADQAITQYFSHYYENGHVISGRYQLDLHNCVKIVGRRYLGEGRIARARRLYGRGNHFFNRISRRGNPLQISEPKPRTRAERIGQEIRRIGRFFFGNEVQVTPRVARTIAASRGLTFYNLGNQLEGVRLSDVDAFTARVRGAGITRIGFDLRQTRLTSDQLARIGQALSHPQLIQETASPAEGRTMIIGENSIQVFARNGEVVIQEANYTEPLPESRPANTSRPADTRPPARATTPPETRTVETPAPDRTIETPRPTEMPRGLIAEQTGFRAFLGDNVSEANSRAFNAFCEQLRARHVSNISVADGVEIQTPEQLQSLLDRIPEGRVRGPRINGQRPTGRTIIIGPNQTAYSISMYEGMNVSYDGQTRTYQFTMNGETVRAYTFNRNGVLEAVEVEGRVQESRQTRQLRRALHQDISTQAQRNARELQTLRQYRRAVRVLAERMGISQAQLRSIGAENMVRNGLSMLGEQIHPVRFLERLSQPEAMEFLQNTREGRAFREWMERGEGRTLLSEGPRSFIMGAITILGIEGLIRLFPSLDGWLNSHPIARFALVLTLAHQGNATLNPLVGRLLSQGGRADIAQHMRAFNNLRRVATRGAAMNYFWMRHGTTSLVRGEASLARILGQHIRNTWWGPGRAPTALGNLLRGLGSMYVAGRVYDGLMSLLVSRDSILRGHAANFIASMGMPIAASALARLAASLTARFVGRTAGALVMGSATVAGSAISGIGIGLMAIELYYAFSTDGYEASFNTRLVQEAQRRGLLSGFDSTRVTVYGENACGSRILSAAVASQRSTDHEYLERYFTTNGLGHLWNSLGGGTTNSNFMYWGEQILDIASELRQQDVERGRTAARLLRAQLRGLRRPGESRADFEARVRRLLSQRVEFNDGVIFDDDNDREEEAYEFARNAILNNFCQAGQTENTETFSVVRSLWSPTLIRQLRERFNIEGDGSQGTPMGAFLDRVYRRMLQDQFAYVQFISDDNLDEETRQALIVHRTRAIRRELQAREGGEIDFEGLATRALEELNRFGRVESEDLLEYFHYDGELRSEALVRPQRRDRPEDRHAAIRELTVDNPLGSMFDDHGVLSANQVHAFTDWVLDESALAEENPTARLANLMLRQNNIARLVAEACAQRNGQSVNIPEEDRELFEQIQLEYSRLIPDVRRQINPTEDDLRRVVSSVFARATIPSDQQYLADNGLLDANHQMYRQLTIEATRLQFGELRDDVERRVMLTQLRLEYLQLFDSVDDEDDPRLALIGRRLEACQDNFSWLENDSYVSVLREMAQTLRNPNLDEDQRQSAAANYLIALTTLENTGPETDSSEGNNVIRLEPIRVEYNPEVVSASSEEVDMDFADADSLADANA